MDKDLGVHDTALMVSSMNSDAMQSWTDDKKREFVGTFKKRAIAAKWLLISTAQHMERIARQRHFISARQQFEWPQSPEIEYTKSGNMIGDRSVEELNKLADERAQKILSELPAVRDAVSVILPDVAKMMDERDSLVKKGQALADRLEEVSGQVSLGEVDQNMTIGAFRQFMKDRAKKRRNLIEQMDEVGERGLELETKINKALYAGIPGISSAVANVIRQHLERAVCFDQTTRRVEEKVMFGDSQAACEMLQTFEKDELTVSDTVRAEFRTALVALKLGPKRSRKAAAS